MGAGKTTLLKQIDRSSTIKCLDVHGEREDELLSNWYRGRFHPLLWESLCVRWYMEKETAGIFNAIEDSTKKEIIFDRSSIDCMSFCVALCVAKFYIKEEYGTADLPDFFSIVSSCYKMISSSVCYLRKVNSGKMIFIELANKHCFINLKKRNRSAETFFESNDWNPSFIFIDDDAFDLFMSVYGYTSIVMGNLFSTQFDDFVVGTNSEDDTLEDQKFKFLKRSENPALNIYQNPLKLSKGVEFKLNRDEDDLTNIFRFIVMMYEQSTLINLFPFHSNELFKGKVCGDNDFILKWIDEK